MKGVMVIVMSVIGGIAQAQDLCKVNPYTANEAKLGKAAFDSKCALCHQFNMSGREPGNALNEFPDITTLSKSDVDFIDDHSGHVPALLGKKFMDKHKAKTLAEFSAFVSSAAIAFPTADMKVPDTYFHLAAYILHKNCGKL